jgi:hypothetical protein
VTTTGQNLDTGVALTLVRAEADHGSSFTQAVQALTTVSDRGLPPSLLEAAVSSDASVGHADAFWSLLGTRRREAVSLWSLDTDEEGFLGG